MAVTVLTAGTVEPKAARFQERWQMLGWALIFLVVALVAAALGFGGIAGTAASIAKILFIVFLVLFAVGLIMHLSRGRNPPL